MLVVVGKFKDGGKKGVSGRKECDEPFLPFTRHTLSRVYTDARDVSPVI